MKTTLLLTIYLLLAAMLPNFILAQQTEGEVTYLETMKFKIEIPEGHEEMMKGMPTSDSFSKRLFFNENAAVYKDFDGAEAAEDVTVSGEGDGMNFKMVMKRPESTFYTDLENGTTINSREFFGRYFLITGEVGKPAWKLTGEQKTVQGFLCRKAAFQDGDKMVEAWFAPQIPVAAGPDGYGNLPGLILELSIGGGDRTIAASKVDLKKLSKGAIEKPGKGKEVTQEEFDKIEAEKMKKMEQEMGGSGKGMRIIIKN